MSAPLPPSPLPSNRSTDDANIPAAWSSAMVAAEVHCRRCGYDLRTLRTDSRCPECGLEIWQSVLHTVDPESSRLPRLRNPAAVGDALFVLTLCMLLGTLLIAARPLAVEVDTWDSRGIMHLRDYVPHGLSWGSAIIFIAGAWAIWRLAPPRGREPSGAIWVDIWLIAVGFTGWIICATLLSDAIDRRFPHARVLILHVATSVTAVVGLVGLRSVLGLIGRRSREYRKARGGRQGVEAMIAAIGGGLIGAAMRRFASVLYLSSNWTFFGSVIQWASTLMLVIGLAYMVVNAWWIRRALRSPPPPIDQVLLPHLQADTRIPDRED